jgi:hypothetical protein
MVDSSPDGIYSLVVNANDLRTGTYYVVVKCGDISPTANFGIMARFEDAELEQGITRSFEICPGEILYHYLSLSDQNVSSGLSAHFTLCVPEESLSELTLVTRMSYPPLRAKTPMEIAIGGSNTSCVTYDVCNDALEAGYLWAGVFGSGLCGTYNISVDLKSGLNCVEERGTTVKVDNAIPLEMESVERSSCGPYQWTDFVVSVFYLN